MTIFHTIIYNDNDVDDDVVVVDDDDDTLEVLTTLSLK